MFNEEAVLPLLADRLRPLADAMVDDGVCAAYEIVAVDDGSTDATPIRAADACGARGRRCGWCACGPMPVTRRRSRPVWRGRRGDVRRHAGRRPAGPAGGDRARCSRSPGRGGVDVVYGVRSDRIQRTRAFKRVVGARVLSSPTSTVHGVDTPPRDAGDYRLMSRATVEAVNALPEHHRVLRFVVPALGFPSASVGYRRAERAAGESQVPVGSSMLRLSDRLGDRLLAGTPLRFATLAGARSAVWPHSRSPC
jgi:hypothetical protein